MYNSLMMPPKTNTPEKAYEWTPQPAAFSLIVQILEDFFAACSEAAAFAARMRRETGTRLIDWIDHIRLNRQDARVARLDEAGYRPLRSDENGAVFENSGGLFPPVFVWSGAMEIAVRVESASDFLAAHQLQREAFGGPLDRLRLCRIYSGRDCAMTIVERHGTRDFAPAPAGAEQRIEQLVHMEKFRTRPRSFENDEEAFAVTNALIDNAIRDLGRDTACDLWFAAERDYWMRRNHAARTQKARQDRLGLGWANQDHHTYRSSRKNFKNLVAVWEKLGFHCRERFYAGREAGWGAQVMEQPAAGIITFNDVDLTPDELMGDFSHEGLQETPTLGTVGVWCELHGDSIFQAGLHHLAAMFDFDALAAQLASEAGIKIMKPFTAFPYLRQAFTEGERWAVLPERIEHLLRQKRITRSQAEQFGANGALGSHLENLERNDGFKGFNQEGVNAIITATDPRKNIGA